VGGLTGRAGGKTGAAEAIGRTGLVDFPGAAGAKRTLVVVLFGGLQLVLCTPELAVRSGRSPRRWARGGRGAAGASVFFFFFFFTTGTTRISPTMYAAVRLPGVVCCFAGSPPSSRVAGWTEREFNSYAPYRTKDAPSTRAYGIGQGRPQRFTAKIRRGRRGMSPSGFFGGRLAHPARQPRGWGSSKSTKLDEKRSNGWVGRRGVVRHGPTGHIGRREPGRCGNSVHAEPGLRRRKAKLSSNRTNAPTSPRYGRGRTLNLIGPAKGRELGGHISINPRVNLGYGPGIPGAVSTRVEGDRGLAGTWRCEDSSMAGGPRPRGTPWGARTAGAFFPEMVNAIPAVCRAQGRAACRRLDLCVVKPAPGAGPVGVGGPSAGTDGCCSFRPSGPVPVRVGG